jgi:primosomal protein N' (replication factor Y) (superfamily II helicase)
LVLNFRRMIISSYGIMPEFCDVALPVPLDMVFTYRLNGTAPVVGGRVLVPFRTERLPGVVTALHDSTPSVQARNVHSVLDSQPVLDSQLLQLGEWISHYYLAPIGEVLRTMLPLSAEVRRAWTYSITLSGELALHDSAQIGASRRSKKDISEQMLEYEVLDYLATGGPVFESTLRSATGASRDLLSGLARRKWIARQDVSSIRDTRRLVHHAVLNPDQDQSDGQKRKKLNANQLAILEALRESGGRCSVQQLRELPVPSTTLKTLVQRGLVEITAELADFHLSSLPVSPHPPRADQLNNAQQQALRAILDSVSQKRFSVNVLHGVTGSGKTAVYLCAMQAVLDAGRSAILLVPEIGLTPAAAANLHRIFGEQVALLHSGLSGDERAQQWHRIHRGEARIVVGTRSAVFAPVRDLALLVVDEEHDSSYKQEETPRYHGRDVAVIRGKLSHAAVVLGSATPSLETYHNTETGKYSLIELRERVERRPLPDVDLVDMRNEFQETGEEQIFSRQLLTEIEQRLSRSEQVIVLLNRRGYSAVVLCRACGEIMQCRNCAIAMTHHKPGASAVISGRSPVGQRLECHYCGFRLAVPKLCPSCKSEYLYFLGTGSEKIEERLHGLFPQARIGRLDRDTVRGRDDFERVLNRLHAGEIDLLVGTQMIAKGHDIHGVTLVGVVGADSALRFPDFRAAESTFQLLTQVAGRAGRGDTPGKVILQTYFPEHYAIQFAAAHDYAGFYAKELKYRRWMHYPPFTSVTNILLRSESLNQAMNYAGIVGRWFDRERLESIRILGPAAAPIVRLKRDYRFHFILKAGSRQKMNTALRAMLQHALEQKVPRTSIIIDVDALSLM